MQKLYLIIQQNYYGCTLIICFVCLQVLNPVQNPILQKDLVIIVIIVYLFWDNHIRLLNKLSYIYSSNIYYNKYFNIKLNYYIVLNLSLVLLILYDPNLNFLILFLPLHKLYLKSNLNKFLKLTCLSLNQLKLPKQKNTYVSYLGTDKSHHYPLRQSPELEKSGQFHLVII